jgi:hypothetical protein
MPVTVAFTPPRATLRPSPGEDGGPDDIGPGADPNAATGGGSEGGESQRLRLTVACGPEPASGRATVVLPLGLSADIDGTPAEAVTTLRYDLPADGFTSWEVSLRATPEAADGRYFVTATIEGTGTGDADTDAGIAGTGAEDAALVTVGEAGPPDRDLPPEELFFRMMGDTQALAAEADVEFPDVADPAVGLSLKPGELKPDELKPGELEPDELEPGERGRLRVLVTSHLASELRGEAQLISPYGTWEAASSWIQPVAVPPNGATEIGFDIAVPGDAPAGWEAWLLVKLMYFGRVRYSPAIRLAAARD